MLNECAVEFDFVDVDLLTGEERKAILDEVRRLNKECSFPTIIIGNRIIIGHKENEIREALGL
jgi:glutaredoxin